LRRLNFSKFRELVTIPETNHHLIAATLFLVDGELDHTERDNGAAQHSENQPTGEPLISSVQLPDVAGKARYGGRTRASQNRERQENFRDGRCRRSPRFNLILLWRHRGKAITQTFRSWNGPCRASAI
jgi:hypothetical protein